MNGDPQDFPTGAQEDLPGARRLYYESLEIAKRLGDQNGIATTLHQLGRLAEEEGDHIEAAQLFGEALAILEKLKSPDAEIGERGWRINLRDATSFRSPLSSNLVIQAGIIGPRVLSAVGTKCL